MIRIASIAAAGLLIATAVHGQTGSALAGPPAAVVQEGTTGGQRALRSTLGAVARDVVAAGLRPPAVVVVGDVVDALVPAEAGPHGVEATPDITRRG